MEMLWTWLLSFFFILTLLCILGYQLVCLVDLEYDYINPYDSSSRINSVIVPEFIVQGVLCFILLIAQHWFMLFVALPHLYYNVNLYMTRRHLVDVTEIYNQLSWEKKQRFFKIGCYGALETNTINQTSLLPPSAHRFYDGAGDGHSWI